MYVMYSGHVCIILCLYECTYIYVCMYVCVFCVCMYLWCIIRKYCVFVGMYAYNIIYHVIPINGHVIPKNGHVIPFSDHVIPKNGHVIPFSDYAIPLYGHVIPMTSQVAHRLVTWPGWLTAVSCTPPDQPCYTVQSALISGLVYRYTGIGRVLDRLDNGWFYGFSRRRETFLFIQKHVKTDKTFFSS